MFVMPLVCFLHLLPHLFVDFVSNQPHSHCHQSPCQCSLHGTCPSIVMTFVITFIVTPIWKVLVWTRVNTCRMDSWVRFRSWSSIRHCPSYGVHTCWVLARVGEHSWCRWSRVCRVVRSRPRRVCRVGRSRCSRVRRVGRSRCNRVRRVARVVAWRKGRV